MRGFSAHRVACLAILVGLLSALVGCKFLRGPDRPTPLPAGARPDDLDDVDDDGKSLDLFEQSGSAYSLESIGQKIQKQKVDELRKREAFTMVEYPRYNTLLLSGGASYGAYCAGVLCGWSASEKKPEDGGRPQFDVVTGISTGSLIAPYAFLGKEYDDEVRRQYTTISNEDIYVKRRLGRGILAESALDNTPLRNRVDRTVTFDLMAKVAAEHKKRRRLYVGTTNLDTKRLVVWDVGAIASKGTPESRQLIVDVLLASAAIPAVFPSVRFNVLIDGQPYEELHVDGGVTRPLFFRSPALEASRYQESDPELLAGSNVFVLVAGKQYADAEGVRPRTIAVGAAAVSSLLYAETRAELYRIYTLCILTGMNFWVSAIPPEVTVTNNSTNFDRNEMRQLFDEGYRRGKEGSFTKGPKGTLKPGPAWDTVPPELRGNELTRARYGLNLRVNKPAENQKPPPPNPGPGGGP